MKQSFEKWLRTAMVVVTLLGVASPQSMAEESLLSLRDIKAIVRDSNKQLKALRAEKGISESGLTRAGLSPNPVLELDGATGGMTGSSGEQRAGISISQEILTGGKIEKRQGIAEAEIARFDHQVKDAEQRLLADATTGYLDLLLAEGRVDLASRAMKLNDQLLLVARERLASGEIAVLDVKLATAELARSTAKKMEAERGIAPLRQRLLSLMGISSAERLKLAAPPKPKIMLPDITALKTLAAQNRSDLQVAVAEQRKSSAALALAEAERVPNVTAGIGALWERADASLEGGQDRGDAYLVGLKLSVPIPVFDRNQANIQEALSRKSSAGIKQQFLRHNIEQEVESAYEHLAAAEKTLKLYEQEIIPQLSENLKLVQGAYRLGEIGVQAVIEEQKKFIDVTDGNLLALHDRNRALVQLDVAVGTELNILDGGTK